jgi:hypothetical protein
VQYLPSHPKFKQKQRIIHTEGHNTLPNFIGCYFPRRDDPEQYSFYCASMLMLLKPWRNAETDLKLPSQSWTSAFDAFIFTAPCKVHHILSGIQYFHECEGSAQRQRANISTAHLSAGERLNEAPEDLDLEEDSARDLPKQTLSEEGLAALIASQVPFRKEMHGYIAVEAARVAKIFQDDDSLPQWVTTHTPMIAGAGDTSTGIQLKELGV